MARSGTRAVLAVALIAMVSACGGNADVPRSEFLGDLGRLERLSNTGQYVTWKKPGIDLKRYSRVLLDPVVVRAAAGVGALDRIRTYFRQSTMLAMNESYPIADEPGRDVLRLRAAIAGLGTSRTTVETDLRDSLTGERVAAIVERPAETPALDSWPDVEKTLDVWAKALRVRLNALRGT